ESQELADLRSKYQHETEYDQLQHDQLLSTDRQRHEQFLEAERSEFRRREMTMAVEMLSDDPNAALQKAYYAGQLNAFLTGRTDAADFGAQFRADRDQQRELGAAQEERDHELALEEAREERQDRRQAAQRKHEKRLREIEADREERRLRQQEQQRNLELNR